MHHETLDRLARRDTLVHRLDPRVKMLAVFLYTFALIATGKYEIVALVPYALFPAFLILFGEVPVRFLLKALVLGIPFVFMVAIFNPFFDTSPQTLVVGSVHWTVSGGVLSCANIILRFLLTASALTAFMATTPFHRIINAFKRLHFPSMLLMVLSFLHRYLFVLVDVARRMRRARDARAVGGRAGAGGRTLALRIKSYTGVLGVLFLRTLDQSERVYAAMLSRGFSGDLPTMGTFRTSATDWLFLVASTVYTLSLFLLAHPIFAFSN